MLILGLFRLFFDATSLYNKAKFPTPYDDIDNLEKLW